MFFLFHDKKSQKRTYLGQNRRKYATIWTTDESIYRQDVSCLSDYDK